jgi:hypothetical protein
MLWTFRRRAECCWIINGNSQAANGCAVLVNDAPVTPKMLYLKQMKQQFSAARLQAEPSAKGAFSGCRGLFIINRTAPLSSRLTFQAR